MNQPVWKHGREPEVLLALCWQDNSHLIATWLTALVDGHLHQPKLSRPRPGSGRYLVKRDGVWRTVSSTHHEHDGRKLAKESREVPAERFGDLVRCPACDWLHQLRTPSVETLKELLG